MSVELVSNDSSNGEIDPLYARRQVLRQLAEGFEHPMQVVVDAEVLLDSGLQHLSTYHWTRDELRLARKLTARYREHLTNVAPYVPHEEMAQEVDNTESELSQEESVQEQNVLRLRPAASPEPGVYKPKNPAWVREAPSRLLLHMVDESLLMNGAWARNTPCSDRNVVRDFDANPSRTLYDEEVVEAAARAVRVCGGCAVRQACLTDAMIENQTDIIRAGLLPWQLKSLYSFYVSSQTASGE